MESGLKPRFPHSQAGVLTSPDALFFTQRKVTCLPCLALVLLMWKITLIFFFFLLLRAALAAYGGSQSRGSNRSYSCRPTPEPQPPQSRAASATYTTAHDNAGSLTHRARPGIKPETSWVLADLFLLRHDGNSYIEFLFFFFCYLWEI